MSGHVHARVGAGTFTQCDAESKQQILTACRITCFLKQEMCQNARDFTFQMVGQFFIIRGKTKKIYCEICQNITFLTQSDVTFTDTHPVNA